MTDLERRKAKTITKTILAKTDVVTGADFFFELIRCLCEQLQVRSVLVGQLQSGNEVQTIAVWANGKLAKNIRYPLAGTPCQNVVNQSASFYASEVQAQFPDHKLLQEMGASSYLGMPLCDSSGKVRGVLAVLDDQPRQDVSLLRQVLETFAKRAAAELERLGNEQQQRGFEQILSSTDDLMSFLDTDLIYQAVNDAYLRAFGKKREEIIGHSVCDLMGREVYENTIRPKLQQCLAGQDHKYESWFEFPNLGRRYVEVTYQPARSDGGDITGIVVNVHDITHRQLVKKELTNSKAMFTSVFDSSPSPMSLSCLSDGRFIAVNEAFCRVMEYNRQELLGHTSADVDLFVDWSDRTAFTQGLKVGDFAPNIELQIRAKSGEIKDVLFAASIIEVDGETCLLSSGQDITTHKRTEAALEQRILALTQPLEDTADIHFEDLFNLDDVQRLQDHFSEAIDVGSIITQIDGTPITQPSNFCRLCNDIIRKTEKGCANCFKSDAILGRFNPDGPVVQPCLSGGLWDAGTSISVGGKHLANWLIGQVRDETQTDEKMRVYAREIGADEEEVIAAFHEVPAMSRQQFDKRAQALFTIANQLSNSAYHNVQQARFIAERKLAEETREALEAQLRQGQKMEAVGQLAGGVAHDFNNILQAVLGYGEMAQNAAQAGEPVLEFLEEILRASERAKTLVSQLLAFSRRQVLDMETLDLNEVIGDLIKMVRRILGEHVILEFLPGHNLGSVHADRGQIGQILTNLCVNARDAMPEGGTITIEVENVRIDEAYCLAHNWALPGRYVQLSITDTGTGMSEETVNHIFEPFFTTKDVNQGTGLGLATVYGLVKQHNGQVEVYSEVGLGSTFKIYLPITERVATSVGDKIQSAVPKGSETILLAEDDDLVLDVAKAFLEEAGYTVLSAQDGEDAVRIFEKHKHEIDLALFDVVMPKLGGRAAIQKIHEIRPDLPTLFCSGYSTNAIHTNFILEENLGLIQKPYHRTDLLRKVRQALDDNL